MQDGVFTYTFDAAQPGGLLSAPDFQREIAKYYEALEAIGKLDGNEYDYFVEDIQRTNPVKLSSVALPRSDGARTTDPGDRLAREYELIVRKPEAAGKLPREARSKMLSLVSGMGTVTRVKAFDSPSYNFRMTPDEGAIASAALRPKKDRVEVEGIMKGTIETVQIHTQRPFFKLYPLVGPMEVKCLIDKGSDIWKHGGQYVAVHGLIVYLAGYIYPEYIRVKSIIPQLEDDLPPLSSFVGMAPDATGEVLSEDFVKDMRHG